MKNLTEKISSQKVAIYIRVSTHWQVDKDSLQVQRRELIAYSEMVLGISNYEIFEDAGYSAKNTDRPDYQRMMSRLRSGEFSHLLVWKIDRISRNLLDFSGMYKELKDLGIVFVSKNEQFDTSNAIGEAMLKIILVFAELERNMTSERVTAVMISRANNGQWNGGRVPFGYRYNKETDTFSIEPSEAEVVKKIASMYEQYQSIVYISKALNESGLRTPYGNQWSPATLHRILTNPFYVGKYRYNVHGDSKKKDKNEWILVEEHHEPILTQKLFDRIQFLLSRNKRGGNMKGETRVSKHIHIFSGLLKCGYCGNNMSATLDRRRANGWRPSTYACGMRRRKTNTCSNKYISDIALGPFVFNYIANIIKAKNNTATSTPLETLERKLLRGPVFENVEHIDTAALEQMKSLFINNTTGLEYRPSSVFDKSNISLDQYNILKERRKKTEIALNRLKSLYLYGDDNIPEKDYIVEHKRLLDTINDLDKQISEIEAEPDAQMINDEFVTKASYFLMVEKLIDARYVDYEKYIRYIDASVPKSFLNTIIEHIVVKDGKITSIVFKNGITHTFTYKSTLS